MTTAASAIDPKFRRAIVILMCVSILNYIDRQILGILATPIKAELQLSDTQLGMLGGLAFGVVYSVFCIPFSSLADRHSRVKVLTAALAIWSAFTALCGMAQGFVYLFLARMGVGMGESGSMGPAYSLISDSVPPNQRGRTLAVFNLGWPIGGSLGLLLGGVVANWADWRVAFFVAGGLGLLVIPALLFGVPEPARGRFDSHKQNVLTSKTGEALFQITAKTSFWLIALAGGMSAIMAYGALFWLPSLFQRTFGLTLLESSYFYGSIVLVGGTVGVWGGGWLSDRYAAGNPRLYALLPIPFLLLAIPLLAAGMFCNSLFLAWPLFMLNQALAMVVLVPLVTALQHIFPSGLRATAGASYQVITNIIGLAFGTVALGWMSDMFGTNYGVNGLRQALLVSLVFYALSAFFIALLSRTLTHDWLD